MSQWPVRKPLDFVHFPRLERCAVTWRPAIRNLFSLPSLQRLIVDRYPHPDLSPLASCHRLKELSLTSRKLERLAGIGTPGSELGYRGKQGRRVSVLAALGIEDVEAIEKLIDRVGSSAVATEHEVRALIRFVDIQLAYHLAAGQIDFRDLKPCNVVEGRLVEIS